MEAPRGITLTVLDAAEARLRSPKRARARVNPNTAPRKTLRLRS